MSRKRRPLPLFEKVEVLSTASEGKAVVKTGEKVLFVTNAVPGDVIDVQVVKKRRRYLEGKAVHFHKFSEKRVEPFCSHFGTCGGCKWQFFNYQEQLAEKQQQVKDNLERIGHLEFEEFLPILPSSETTYYRNKLEYTFSAHRWLTNEEIQSEEEIKDREAVGFHIKGMYDKILDIKHCYLQPEPSNAIRLSIKEYALKNNVPFFDLREQKGYLRNLIIRTSNIGQVMVILSVYEDKDELLHPLLNHLVESFPEITSLYYVVNDKKNDSMDGLSPLLFNGEEHITEEMEGLKFQIGPRSFFQTNSKQAYELYKIARDFAGIKTSDLVYDLYTGTGTIALFVAKLAQKVVGIEYVEDAIKDAQKNAIANKIENTDFFAGDILEVLTDEFVSKNGQPDIIITDPPRAGMHKDVVEKIESLKAQKIVYISCNPATQARDLSLLKDSYKVLKVQPVDMFPHTHHVENVVLLELK